LVIYIFHCDILVRIDSIKAAGLIFFAVESGTKKSTF